ncbi:tRNA dihydrouridine(20/20a) synthase DusA [Aureimonas jatrophae]|uniref:tRNA-dihydrouridine(20/20a) synthase n=1 Tax=Aureimonas jatrophae TaxID=1166073 RepID=A0A1H0GDJ6_9HYPH|nr:tRNA dihydrouridine(20/20a) synthase DusA [Aureimonas jatrophae]MBB3949521.1 tRNA-dihydrouridine synthase A [Aureimonas jatrophae]SDO04952.1 tRNA-U16,U17-dihydrouridine synthase [Aureimonas jatrophae]
MTATTRDRISLYQAGMPVFAVAPMIDWTDRHCRMLHRLLAPDALLYTEMVVADAVLHGDQDRILGFHPAEHPVALQLGGSDPQKLARAAAIGAEMGYDEINLNVGCPSDRVQSGAFGACLMREPRLVGACLRAMRDAVDVPVTVKCRIGVDEQDPGPALDALADEAVEAGATAIWVHARKAWLQGLSPKENREIPPLDYDRVYALKRRLPNVFVGLNGGLTSVAAGAAQLDRVDGVMLGRAAYGQPDDLRNVSPLIARTDRRPIGDAELIEAMMAYADSHIQRGGRLGQVTRHMTSLFTGRPGARRWRQILSEEGARPGADVQVLARAFAEVQPIETVAA